MDVMARYRELGSTIEASIQVRQEAEREADRHWHLLGRRCACGHLTVPARFYVDGWDKEKKEAIQVSHEKAEERYLGWLAGEHRPLHGLDGDAAPQYVNPPVMGELQTDSANLQTSIAAPPDTDAANKGANTNIANTNLVCSCGKPVRPRGKSCWGCYRKERRRA